MGDDDERQFFSFKYMASESGNRILGLTWTNHDKPSNFIHFRSTMKYLVVTHTHHFRSESDVFALNLKISMVDVFGIIL